VQQHERAAPVQLPVQLACNPVQLAWRPPPYNPRAAARAARLHGADALVQPLKGEKTSITAGIGRCDGERAADKAGAQVQTVAWDATTTASLLFQHRGTVEALRHAVTRKADGSASTSWPARRGNTP
jgi:hypothetical protein